MRHGYPGKLVAFEGADGVGKSTQVKMTVHALEQRGMDCVSLYEPTRESEWGIRLRELMQSKRGDPMEEFELFKKDRRYDVDVHIMPALREGKIVCIDRYYASSMAYQGALGVPGLTPERIRAENEVFAPEPDLLLYLELPLEIAEKRITCERGQTLDTFEQSAYQARVRDIFEKYVVGAFDNVARIDTSGTVEATNSVIVENILKLFNLSKG